MTRIDPKLYLEHFDTVVLFYSLALLTIMLIFLRSFSSFADRFMPYGSFLLQTVFVVAFIAYIFKISTIKMKKQEQ